MGNRYVPIEERFWAKVDKSGDCWTWTAGRNGAGYGSIKASRERRMIAAHRLSWELHRGAVPETQCVLHKCDNPPCVNPAHLFLGDRAINNADKVAKGRLVNPIADAYRARAHCKSGHEFTAENTRMYRGARQCLSCMRAWNRARRPRRAA